MNRNHDRWICACGASFASGSAITFHMSAAQSRPSQGLSHRVIAKPF